MRESLEGKANGRFNYPFPFFDIYFLPPPGDRGRCGETLGDMYTLYIYPNN